MSKLRKTGIDVLGDIPWGSHFCNFYETKQDLLDIIVPYFKAGLENKEFCMWVVPNAELISVEEAKQALKEAIPDLDRHLSEGNVEIHNGPDWYLKENVFNLERLINAWHVKLKQALALGHDGMRVSGDTFWLSEKHWKDFYAYEKKLNSFIIDLPITLLCTYPLAKSYAADILDVVHAHQFTIARRQGEWEVLESAGLKQAQAEIKRLNEAMQQVKERSRKSPAILSYGLAGLSVIAALLILLLMKTKLPDAAPYASVFFCAVIFSTWFGGVGPGLLSIVLSALAFDYYFMPPIHSLAIEPSQYSRILLFMIPSLFIVWLSATRKSATESLRGAQNVLEEAVQNLRQTIRALHEEIAERKKSELLIIKEKELSNEIIDSIPGAFVVLDENFRFVRWNKNVELVMGYSQQEILQLHAMNDFYDDADERKKVQSLMEEAFEKGTIQGEVFAYTKDKRKIFFYFNGRQINYEGKTCIICTAIDITERKQAEDALRKSEDRFRLVTDTIPALVWSALPDGSVDFINQRHREFTGLSLDEVRGWRWTGVIHPEDRTRVVHEWRTALATRETWETETRLRRAYGDYRWLLIRAVPLCDESGKVVKWYGTKTDITERKEVEEKLKQSEGLLAEAEHLAHVGSWSLDLRNNFVTWSEELCFMFGIRLSEFDHSEETVMGFIHPDYRGIIRAVIEDALKTHEPFSIYHRIIRADGKERIIHLSGDVEIDEHGNPLRMYGAAQDVTESKHAEDELRLAYQRLSDYVENTPLAVIEFDRDLFIKRWSKLAEEIFGWKTSEALGKNVYDPNFPIIYKEDIQAVDKINEQLTKGVVNRNLSINRNCTKEGNIIYCEWYNSVLRDEYGNVVTILSLVHDVTEREKAEETLNQSYEEIRRLTGHLQKIREEERAYIAREIHDELGQQLTALKMDVKGLSKKLNQADESIRQKINDIIDLLDTTVKSVRRISSELRPSLLHNLGLVAAMEWHLKEFEKKSGIKIIFNEPEEELETPDPIKIGLFRIFQESLTNIGRHANANKTIVTLERKDEQLILSIEDDGQGFEKERIAAKQTLGILGMKERSQIMGGNYDIKSVLGKGTTVIVAVPYNEVNNLV